MLIDIMVQPLLWVVGLPRQLAIEAGGSSELAERQQQGHNGQTQENIFSPPHQSLWFQLSLISYLHAHFCSVSPRQGLKGLLNRGDFKKEQIRVSLACWSFVLGPVIWIGSKRGKTCNRYTWLACFHISNTQKHNAYGNEFYLLRGKTITLMTL